ncbi:MAG: cation-translocating P-type ATPase C-terminal domain-containing protein, partial [Hylemonella sp.]|nr:cation-translocating P-type ATPase C-terminal domain-containing protein [Hylemonella sp.]
FSALVLGNLALILSNRAGQRGLLASLRVPNPMLWAMSALTLVLLGLAVYVPPVAAVLHLAPLSPLPAALVVAGAGVSLLWFAAIRVLARRWGAEPG